MLKDKYIKKKTFISKYYFLHKKKLAYLLIFFPILKKKTQITKYDAKLWIFLLLLNIKFIYFYNFRLKHQRFLKTKRLRLGRRRLKSIKRFRIKFFKNYNTNNTKKLFNVF